MARALLALLSTTSCASAASSRVAHTLRQAARCEVVIKKSRFVALAAPVTSTHEAMLFVKRNADPKARHNCFAFRLLDGYSRTNGDGEPGGTAGPPILAAIDGANLSNVAVLVSRFRLGEGAKLGTGGLVRAYGGTAARCLQDAPTLELEARLSLKVEYAVEDTGLVYNVVSSFAPRSLLGPGCGCALEVSVPASEAERVSCLLRESTKGRAVVTPS